MKKEKFRVCLLWIMKKKVILILNNLEINFERFLKKAEAALCLFSKMKISFFMKKTNYQKMISEKLPTSH